MSSGGPIASTAASGGHDWLFADPFAYQYSEIPLHVRDLRSRSQSPISPGGGAAGAAASELEAGLPRPVERVAAHFENIELEACSPVLPPAPRPRYSSTSPSTPPPPPPPPPPTTAAAATTLPRSISEEDIPSSLAVGQRCQPHLLNNVQHSEIVRSRHANVRLSRKYPIRRNVTESAAMPLSRGAARNEPSSPRPHAPSSSHPIPRYQQYQHPASRSGPPPSQVPSPVQAAPPKPRRTIPINANIPYEDGLLVVEQNVPTAPKLDFDTILKDFNPVRQAGNKRRSRAIKYQDKYSTWGA